LKINALAVVEDDTEKIKRRQKELEKIKKKQNLPTGIKWVNASGYNPWA